MAGDKDPTTVVQVLKPDPDPEVLKQRNKLIPDVMETAQKTKEVEDPSKEKKTPRMTYTDALKINAANNVMSQGLVQGSYGIDESEELVYLDKMVNRYPKIYKRKPLTQTKIYKQCPINMMWVWTFLHKPPML